MAALVIFKRSKHNRPGMAAKSDFHPLTWPEVASWRKQQRLLVITFIGLPVVISAVLWTINLATAKAGPTPDFYDSLTINVWGLQIFLSLWLTVLVVQRSTPGIAHLRETAIWPLAKVMPFSLSDLFSYKALSIEKGLKWPIRLILFLRVASVGLWLLNTTQVTQQDCVFAVLFGYVFCAELLVSVRFNCAIGLLASSISPSTARATATAYIVEVSLFAGVFAPLWWIFIQGWPYISPIFQSGDEAAIILAGTLQYGELAILQMLIIAICYSLAIRRAENLVE